MRVHTCQAQEPEGDQDSQQSLNQSHHAYNDHKQKVVVLPPTPDRDDRYGKTRSVNLFNLRVKTR